MLKVGILKPFKLKTTNGNMLAYYGNCNINLTTVPFRDMKKANKEETPFISEHNNILYKHTNTKRMKTTTHVLAVHHTDVFGDNESEVVIKSPTNSWNGNEGSDHPTILYIPNLNDTTMNERLNSFINSIIDKPLKKSLQMIFYNITHGETPYANVDYQEGKYYENTFALYTEESDYPINRPNLPNATGADGYPQNSIIFQPQNWNVRYPFFYYNTDTTTRNINTVDTCNTLPYHGICGISYSALYFYWTTYKGV